MKKTQQLYVRVNGKGESKQRAFAIALSQVQKEVFNHIGNIVLRIEPQDIQVVSAKKMITTERFLFVFLPRKRTLYDVTLDVSVNVSFVDLADIEFKSE